MRAVRTLFVVKLTPLPHQHLGLHPAAGHDMDFPRHAALRPCADAVGIVLLKPRLAGVCGHSTMR